MKSFFRIAYVALSVVVTIAASWFLGMTETFGYQGAWIFGVTWLPILVFGFIEYVNAQSLPESSLKSFAAVFLPYLWIFIVGFLQEQSLAEMVIGASLSTFIAAFVLHAFALRVPFLQAGKTGFAEVLVPHLVLYGLGSVFAVGMIAALWNLHEGSFLFVLGLAAAIVQRIYGMYPQLKHLLS